MDHEHALIDPFLKSAKRARYRIPMPARRLAAENLVDTLLKRRSNGIAHVISEDPAIDGRELPLEEAILRTVGYGMESFLSRIPGRLAFVETEDDRFILERHIPEKKPEYVRFVIGQKDFVSQVELGIFHAAGEALESLHVTGPEAKELRKELDWFNEHLVRPDSFGRGRISLGICWFKSASVDHLARIRRVVNVLERCGVFVKKIRTSRPGYVVYEDEWQIVAEPFRKGTLGS